jgi:hypothetical protein
MITLRLCVLRRKTTEAKFHFHHIISRVHIISRLITVAVDLGHLVQVVLTYFPTSYLSTLLPVQYSVERSHYVHPTRKKSLLARFHSWTVDYLAKLLGIILSDLSLPLLMFAPEGMELILILMFCPLVKSPAQFFGAQ